MSTEVQIDFFKIYDTAGRGIRRAAVFLGLGVNSSESDAISDYHLSKHTNFHILPEMVSGEVLSEWKKEYRIWVVGCGFRELVDRFCVFLDQIHHVSCLIGRRFSEKAQTDFKWLGLDKKIEKLKSEFGISYVYGAQIASFYPVRNCFVHRLGHVGTDDLKGGASLTLRFMRLASVFTGSSGVPERIPDIFDPLSPPFITPEAGSLGLQWSEEILSFRENEWVALTPKQLTDILFFADLAARQFTMSAVDYGRWNGLIIRE
ncbi:MAG: hypothetical protein PHE83_01320 [Opitutaceae bacterium]|nr:hypothetical protein [Opitutaceae bacterium]